MSCKIGIVRSTNIIPFDGIVRPISNDQYICKKLGTKFSNIMGDFLRKNNVIETITPSMMFSDDYDKIVKKNADILRDYLPYTSDYNSMVLFSLNGICPDDNTNGFANNTFSNRLVGIIDSLESHINDCISLNPTDTAIKGDVLLSSNSKVLIAKQLYDSLNEMELKILNKNCNVVVFDGFLKDAIETQLKEMGYNPEQLSLSSSSGGFIDSDTSKEVKASIDNLASNYNISKTKFFNLITSTDENMPHYEDIKDEIRNISLVDQYYISNFIKELFLHMNFNVNDVDNISTLRFKPYEDIVREFLDNLGVEKYKQFVDMYNKKLEEDKKNNELYTPEEIINKIIEKGKAR